MKFKTIASLFLLAGMCGCSDAPAPVSRGTEGYDSETKSEKEDQITQSPTLSFELCKGADVSWLTEMEALGYKFYYNDGTEGDCLEILKSKGVNAIRLRVWVNPPNGYCDVNDVLAKALRAKALGLPVMIDFHYSDVWADPGAQTIPSDWTGYDLEQMIEAVGQFTTSTLRLMADKGIDVKWVQIGNETGNGMLWPLGQADKNPEGYARLTQAGIDAVHEVLPDAKTIVHLQSGENSSLAQWLLGILAKYGVTYDIAGFSLYPERTTYEEFVSKAKTTMEGVIRKFDKDVMLCEVGMPFQYQNQCYDFLTLCFDLSKQIPDDRFKGVFYWEPECYKNFNGYNKGAFLSNGQPSKAMDAFSFSGSGIRPVYAD